MTIKLHSLGHKDPHGVSEKSCQVTIAHVLHLRVPWPETSLSSKLQLCAVYFLLPTRLQETLISSSPEIQVNPPLQKASILEAQGIL